jgi:hypothetical protein
MTYIPPSITSSSLSSIANFTTWQAAGAAGHLEALISAQAGTSNPTTAATASATGGGTSGGSLAAGTYYFVYTETNGIGETTPSSQGTSLVVSTGDKPTVTFPTLQTGNVARNLYLGTTSGGPYYLYASGISTTSTTLSAAAAVPNVSPGGSFAVNPPTVNSTTLTYEGSSGTTQNMALALLRGAKDGNLEDTWRFLRTLIAGFNSGAPASFNGMISNLHHAHTVFAILSQLCLEAGIQIDGNAGTLGTAATGINERIAVRTWP